VPNLRVMGRLKRLGLVIGVLISLVPGLALAQGTDAQTPPETAGPLVPISEQQCQGGQLAVPGFGIVAESEVCLWLYRLAPVETNVEDDFTAFWLQYEVIPYGGWCVVDVEVDLRGPDDGRILSTTALRDGKYPTDKKQDLDLVVDGDGTAPIPGSILQKVTAPRGRVTSRTSNNRFTFGWKGASDDPVMFAWGLQTSHPSPHLLDYSEKLGLRSVIGGC
jgi:hypothetical protein